MFDLRKLTQGATSSITVLHFIGARASHPVIRRMAMTTIAAFAILVGKEATTPLRIVGIELFSIRTKYHTYIYIHVCRELFGFFCLLEMHANFMSEQK